MTWDVDFTPRPSASSGVSADGSRSNDAAHRSAAPTRTGAGPFRGPPPGRQQSANGVHCRFRARAEYRAAGIVATVGASLAHGPIGAVISAWPALTLVASFELLMLLIRNQQQDSTCPSADATLNRCAPALEQQEPSVAHPAVSLEQTVRARHGAGHSQRTIARELSIDRRKVKQTIERAA